MCSSTPKQPQESPESHGQAESENKEELENGEVENGNEPDSDAIDGNVEASKGDVDKENTRVADPRAKSGRKSMQRSSGWRRKSKRSSPLPNIACEQTIYQQDSNQIKNTRKEEHYQKLSEAEFGAV